MVLSLAVGFVLMGVKFFAYYLTRSAAIFSDALENIVNVFSSGFAMYAVLLAHRPADKEHPYGHGKIEFFSAGFEGGMILLAAVLIVGAGGGVASSLRARTQDLTCGPAADGRRDARLRGAGAVPACASGGGPGRSRWRRTAQHLLSRRRHQRRRRRRAARRPGHRLGWVDPVGGAGGGRVHRVAGARPAARSAAGLMDEQDAADARLLRRILDAHTGPRRPSPAICSYHKLRHRHSGRYHWVDFHIVVPAWWDVAPGHRVASTIEYEIEQALGEGNATAHVEPCTLPACPRCEASRVSRMS